MLGARRGWGAGPALPPTAPGRGERQRTRKTRVPGLRAHVPRAVASCTANVAEDGGDPGSADTGRPAPGVRRLLPGLPARPAGEALRLKVCRPLGQAPSVLPVRGGGPSLAGGTKPALGRALEPPRAPPPSALVPSVRQGRGNAAPVGSSPRAGCWAPASHAPGGTGVGWGPAQAPSSPAASAAPCAVAWAWGQT